MAARELPIPNLPIGRNNTYSDAILLWLACNHNTPKISGPCKNHVLLTAGCWRFTPQSMTKRSKHGYIAMLWWLIGAWVASGLLIPVLWLLSIAGRRALTRPSNHVQAPGASARLLDSKQATLNSNRIGRFLLSGLAGAGAVILLFVGSFGDPITAIGELYSAFADSHTPVSQPAVARAPLEAVLAVDQDEAENGRQDRARQPAVAVPQGPPSWTLAAMSTATPPASPDRPGKRGRHHGRRGPVGAYVTQSHRGTWLFPPNASAGGNS